MGAVCLFLGRWACDLGGGGGLVSEGTWKFMVCKLLNPMYSLITYLNTKVGNSCKQLMCLYKHCNRDKISKYTSCF